MCVNSKTSSPEVIENLALSRLSLLNFDAFDQHTGNSFAPCELLRNGSNRTRKVDGIDHDRDDG